MLQIVTLNATCLTLREVVRYSEMVVTIDTTPDTTRSDKSYVVTFDSYVWIIMIRCVGFFLALLAPLWVKWANHLGVG
jgi:hypothetical protein